MNPYDILGVNADASPQEIKSAYRKLAMQYHPDRNQDEDSIAKFHEIQAAYEQITKPKVEEPEIDFSDIFRGFGFSQAFARRNSDYQSVMHLTLEQLYEGCEQAIDLNGQVITITVPKGSQQGTRFKIAGAGGTDYADLPAGDLYVIVNVLRHDVFQYGGEHLQMVVDIPVMELITGSEINVMTISGKRIDVTIPPSTRPNSKLRISGQGMPMGDQYGDLFIVMNPVMPHYDEKIIEALKKVVDKA